jgi:hypothetical protein
MRESKYHPIERIGVAIRSVRENHTTRFPSVANHDHVPVPIIVMSKKRREASLGVDMPR